MAQAINSITSFLTEGFSDLSKIKASKGFLSIFGRAPDSRTEYVENATQISIDIKRGYKFIAQLLQRSEQEGSFTLGGNVKNYQAEKFEAVSYDFPIVRADGSITYENLLKYRSFNEVPVNSGMGAMEKAREKMMEIFWTNIPEMVGRMEKEAVESLTTGKITLDDGVEYDFNRSTSNTITPLTLWSVTATASPIGDMDDICDAIQENGKTEAMAAVIGYSALNAMVNTNEIKNLADNRRFEFVQVGSATKSLPDLPSDMQYLVANGFKYCAFMKTYKGRDIYFFTYNEKYQASGGAWTDYMNAKDVFVFDHTARYDRYFGPMIRFPIETENERLVNQILGIDGIYSNVLNQNNPTGVLDARMFHTDAFLNETKTAILVDSYGGPLLVPTHVDACGLLDGVIA